MTFPAKKFIFFFLLFFVFLLNAGFVFALELHYPTIMGFSVNDTSGFPEYARYFFNLGIFLAAFIAVGVIAWGGILVMFGLSIGKIIDPKKGTRAPAEAIEWIKAGISGLLLVVCAYLIAFTINPDLVVFKLGNLLPIGFQNNPNSPYPPGVDFTSYQEIPIGTLTENLLTRTEDSCYGFDANGNPVPGQKITTDNGQNVFAPTYIDHDRADCLLKLADGAEKKSQIIALLSDEITKLMNKCDCQTYGQCADTCGGAIDPETKKSPGCDDYSGVCPPPNGAAPSCTGKCVGAGCKAPIFKNAPSDCCPTGVKNKIEHGPVQVGCGAQNAFGGSANVFLLATATTCQSSDPSKPGYCSGAMGVCIGNVCAPLGSGGGTGGGSSCNMCTTPTVMFAGLDEFRCPNPKKGASYTSCDNIANFVEKQVKINKKTITVIDPDKWNKLNLAQQLSYYKEKIDEIKQKIKKDADKLNQAKETLSSCYPAIPYVDLLKAYETTDQTAHIITIKKTFTDPKTNSPVDISKYCKGFNYGNSDCLKKCNDLCPDTSSQAMEFYSQCENCTGNDQACLNRQELCIEKAYSNRPCTQQDSSQNYKNFGDCISSCQNDCSNICSKQYLPNSSEFKLCQSQCSNNSKCVLDNASTCLFGAQAFKDCATQATDQGNIKSCIDKAYLCKNGSDEYAGYPDCTAPVSKKCPAGQFSSSFLYQSFVDNYPGCEQCPFPLDSLAEGGASCQDLYPETEKCPSASNCPNCPCDKTDQNIQFCIPNESTKNNAGKEGAQPASAKFSAYEITSSQCNEYAFNDDPLTFYCQDNWWMDPSKEGDSLQPIGTEMICPKEGEVPVGQTVDNAENWAKGLMDSADKMNKNIKNVLDKIEKAGKAKDTSPVQDYCKCNARFDNSNNPPAGPICKTDCKFNQAQVPVLNADGSPTGDTETKCTCDFTSCQGSPCQQVVNYLSDVWNSYRQFQADFINFYASMIQDAKSDIIKELAYSRQTTNSCSLVNSAFALNERLLNCTWAGHQIISPVSGSQTILNGVAYDGCYGGQSDGHLGKEFNLTDNWFCCQQYSKNPAQNQQK